MDITYCSIILGITLCTAYALVRGIRQRSFDLNMISVVFLSSFGLLTGGSLIQAGLSGKPENLPVYWRQYVAVGGIVAIGIAVQFLITAFRNAWPKPAREFNDEVSQKNGNQSIKDSTS